MGQVWKDFRLDELEVVPHLGQISNGTLTLRIEPLVMDLLATLAMQPGTVIARDDLLAAIWAHSIASDESLTRAVSQLRKALHRLAPGVRFIETIPKRGYRLVPTDIHPPPAYQTGAVQSGGSEVDELVLQAQSLNRRPFHTDVLQTALSLLERAVALDPAHALAHSELGHTYSLMGTYLPDSDKAALTTQAADCGRRALPINPQLGVPHTLLALERFAMADIVGALRISERAHAIAPEDPEVTLRLGYFLAVIGLTGRAIPLLEKAVALDPIQGRNYQIIAKARLSNGDLAEADRLAQSAIDLQHHFASECHAAIAFAMDDSALAGERLLRSRTYLADFLGDKFVDPSVWEKIVAQAYSPVRAEREALGRWITAYLFVPGQPAAVSLTQTIARTGPPEAFFDIMGDTPPPGAHGTFLSLWGQTETPVAIRSHDRFPAFCDSMGMTDAWRVYGLPDCLS